MSSYFLQKRLRPLLRRRLRARPRRRASPPRSIPGSIPASAGTPTCRRPCARWTCSSRTRSSCAGSRATDDVREGLAAPRERPHAHRRQAGAAGRGRARGRRAPRGGRLPGGAGGHHRRRRFLRRRLPVRLAGRASRSRSACAGAPPAASLSTRGSGGTGHQAHRAEAERLLSGAAVITVGGFNTSIDKTMEMAELRAGR